MNPDFRDFFALLRSHRVEFLVLGGVAYNFYAPPRSTKDIDVWARPSRENLERLKDAIAAFGFPTEMVDVEALLSEQGRVLMLGRVPNRIDVLTRPSGVEWDGAWAARSEAKYGDVDIWILSRPDLIRSKRAAGRPRDLADVAALEEVSRSEHPSPPTKR